MSLGETLDEVREEHIAREASLGTDPNCEICQMLDRIQKAYAEMIASLKVLEDSK